LTPFPIRFQREFEDQLAGDGSESVAVVIAERGQPMTLTAKIHGLIKPHGLWVLAFP